MFIRRRVKSTKFFSPFAHVNQGMGFVCARLGGSLMSLQNLLARLSALLDLLQSEVAKAPLSSKGFLNLQHAAEYCDLSEESLRRLCNSRKLTALRPVKGRILIDRKELDAYIRSCDQTPRTGRGRHRDS